MPVFDQANTRQARLQAFIDAFFAGNKSAAGRALGYRDGAFLGQMLQGARPITEKTVAQIHALQGAQNWFVTDQTIAVQPVSELDSLTGRLRQLDQPARESAAVLMQGLARDPDGPWAAWLTELMAAPAQATQLATSAIVKEPFHYKKVNQPTQKPLKRKHQ